MPAMLIPSFFIADDQQARMIFLGMFILIGVTDKLDGTIARYLNQTSHLGAKLDTMADMVFYPLIALWLYRFSPQVVDGWWFLIYILLGCIFESMSMILLTVPIFAPLVQTLGFDLIWFGILVVVVTEISLITPPIGLNVFVLKGVIKNVSVGTIFYGVTPFWISDIIRLLILTLIPGIALFLPSMMF